MKLHPSCKNSEQTSYGLPLVQIGETEAPAYMEVRGKYYPVTAMVRLPHDREVPLLDIPMMSDFRWQLLSLKSRLETPELYRPTEDVETVTAELRKWLLEHVDEATPEERKEIEELLKGQKMPHAALPTPHEARPEKQS